MRNSTQTHLRFLTLAAVHKVLKDRTEVLVLKVRWTFVSTDRSGTEKLKVQRTFASADRSEMEIRTRSSPAME